MDSSALTIRNSLRPYASQTISILSREIGFVLKHIENVTKTKDRQMQELEDKKRKLKQAAGSGVPNSVLERNIKELMANRKDLLDEITQLTQEAVRDKKNIDVISEALTAMDREVARIQADHDKGIIALREKNATLKNKLHVILEVDEMIANLEKKILEDTDTVQKEMEEAEALKMELRKREDLSEEEIEAQIKVVDDRMFEARKKYMEDNECMEKQKLDIETEFEAILQNVHKSTRDLFVSTPVDYIDEVKRLEELRLHVSPLKQKAIDRAIEFYRSKIEDYETRQSMSPAERVKELLEQRGLVMTDCGEIRDADGKLITKAIAQEIGLVEDLEKSLAEDCGLHYIDPSALLTPDGMILSKEQAQKMGIMSDYNVVDVFAEESIRSDLSSRDSDFQSEDAFYLKKNLGVPLTLALAEITVKQPRDPIHYLGHWLYKYRYNQEVELSRKIEVDQLTQMRNKIAKEKWMEFLEDEARQTVLQVIERAESQGDRHAFELELQRIADEAEAMEEENEEDQDALAEEARDTLGEYNGPTVNQRGSTRVN